MVDRLFREAGLPPKTVIIGFLQQEDLAGSRCCDAGVGAAGVGTAAGVSGGIGSPSPGRPSTLTAFRQGGRRRPRSPNYATLFHNPVTAPL